MEQYVRICSAGEYVTDVGNWPWELTGLPTIRGCMAFSGSMRNMTTVSLPAFTVNSICSLRVSGVGVCRAAVP